MLDWLKPLLVRVLASAGKYIVPPIAAYIGYAETQVGDVWIGVADIVCALALAAASAAVDRWWTRKTADAEAKP